MARLPKAVYPHELSDHEAMFREFITVQVKETGKLLCFPACSPALKRKYTNCVKHSDKLDVVDNYYAIKERRKCIK